MLQFTSGVPALFLHLALLSLDLAQLEQQHTIHELLALSLEKETVQNVQLSPEPRDRAQLLQPL